MLSNCKRYSQHNKYNPKCRKCVFLLEKTEKDPYYTLCLEHSGNLHIITDEDRKSCSRFTENKPEHFCLREEAVQARKEASYEKMSGKFKCSDKNEDNL